MDLLGAGRRDTAVVIPTLHAKALSPTMTCAAAGGFTFWGAGVRV